MTTTLKTIKVKPETFDRVAAQVRAYGETMDEIMRRILDELDECRRSHKGAHK